MAPYAKGQSGNPAGRRPGTPNRVTAVVREAVLAAFDEVGGKDYLVQVARNEPKVFCALLARLVPTQVRAELETTLPVVVLRDYTGLENGRDGANEGCPEGLDALEQGRCS